MELRQRLIDRIRDRGPITFAEFMEAALYDPEEGFYARPPVGEGGHFVTSPHVSPAFGDLVARQLAQAWDLLEKPRPFTVIEVGAGDGTLARQIRGALTVVPEVAASLRYVAVERSEGARASLSALPLDEVRSEPPQGPVVGCVVANEVLDNVPFHRLRGRDGGVVEVRVGALDGELVEVEAEPHEALRAALPAPLRHGEERPVSPGSLALVRDLARMVHRGYVFLFDYGFEPGVRPGPVHAYRDHHVLADVLEAPGSRDVTAAVDLAAVSAEARRAGLEVWGPVPQRDALLALGFRSWMRGVRDRQAEAYRAGRWREAMRLFEQRSRASILVDPNKLGGLHLVAFGTRDLPPPAAVLGDAGTGC